MYKEILTRRKRDTKEGLGRNLVRIHRHPKLENLELMHQIAWRHGLMVRQTEAESSDKLPKGHVWVEIRPVPGNQLPDWNAFWKEYEEKKKHRD